MAWGLQPWGVTPWGAEIPATGPLKVRGHRRDIPGGIGLHLDDASRLMLRFDERSDAILPSDETGNLEDFHLVDAMPVVTDAMLGPGRLFAQNDGLATDDTDGNLALTGDITVQAILEWKPQDLVGLSILLFRGLVADKTLEVDIEEANGALTVYSPWSSAAGIHRPATQTPFEIPDGFFLLTVTRRFVSLDEAEVSFYANDALIDRVTVAETDCGKVDDPTNAEVVISTQPFGAGSYNSGRLSAIIDELHVLDRAMSPEEVRQVYRRIFVIQEQGPEIVRALLPEGVYSTAPDSVVQREIALEGYVLAEAMAKTAELLEDGQPQRAWSLLDAWEEATQQSGPAGSIEERRERVLSVTRAYRTGSPAEIKEAIAPLFGIDADDVEIIEGSHRDVDAFDGAELDETWQFLDEGVGSVSVAGGKVTISHDGTGDIDDEPSIRKALDYDPLRSSPALADISAQLVAAPSILNARAWIGFTSISQFGRLVALAESGGSTYSIGWEDHDTGLTVLATGLSGAMWMRVTFEEDGTYTARWDADEIPAPGVPGHTAALGRTGPALPACVALGIRRGTAVSVSCEWDNWQMFQPNSRAPWRWYAYRDEAVVPAGSPEPDMVGAQELVDRRRPAHTYAKATRRRYVLFDDSLSGFDAGGMA